MTTILAIVAIIGVAFWAIIRKGKPIEAVDKPEVITKSKAVAEVKADIEAKAGLDPTTILDEGEAKIGDPELKTLISKTEELVHPEAKELGIPIITPTLENKLIDGEVVQGLEYKGTIANLFFPVGSVMYEGAVHQLQSLEQGGIYRSELWWQQQEALAQAGKPQALYLALIGDNPPQTEAEAEAIVKASSEAYQIAGGYPVSIIAPLAPPPPTIEPVEPISIWEAHEKGLI